MQQMCGACCIRKKRAAQEAGHQRCDYALYKRHDVCITHECFSHVQEVLGHKCILLKFVMITLYDGVQDRYCGAQVLEQASP
eukprot:6210880-Karenia_brevis.AAC.1